VLDVIYALLLSALYRGVKVGGLHKMCRLYKFTHSLEAPGFNP
jgi:hypothetical protein